VQTPAVEDDLAKVCSDLLPKLPTAGALRVRAGSSTCRSPRHIIGVGFVEESRSVITHGTGGAVAVDAICKRVLGRPVGDQLLAPPLPNPLSFGGMDKYVRKVVKLCPRPALLPLEEVALTWDACKRKFYHNVAKRVSGLAGLSKDARVRCFVKPEKHFVVDGIPTARIISPRSPRYNIRLAQYLKPLEKSVYHALDLISDPVLKTVLKCANSTERGDVIRQHMEHHGGGAVAVGLDASRFDQHVSEAALRAEHSIYLGVYGNDSTLRRLLECQLKNVCTLQAHDCHLSWTTEGGRMSGDMNTSLGNVALSVLMLNLLRDDLGFHMTFINDGDDCVCFFNKVHLAKFMSRVKDFYLQFGFTMKVEKPVYIIEQVEFCQSKPVLFPDGYRMIRDPWKVIRQDGFYVGNVKGHDVGKWSYGVGHCGLMATSGCPILQDYYIALMRAGTRHKVNIQNVARGSGHTRRALQENRAAAAAPITDETRASFWLAYGIDATQQRGAEVEMRGLVLAEVSAPTETVF